MAKFDSENQPQKRRSKSKLTLVLEAIRSEKLLDTDESTSQEDAERAVFAFLAKTAFTPTAETAALANTCMATLMKKAWPDSKLSNDPINFKFDRSLPPSDNAHAIMDAVASGEIPPDVGMVLIGGVKDIISINESTELVQRLERIEQQLTQG